MEYHDVPEPTPYEQLVLRELGNVRDELGDLRAQVVSVRVDIATLKVKSGIWGAAAGFVPAAITAVAVLVSQGGL